jgi:hypothetical protein
MAWASAAMLQGALHKMRFINTNSSNAEARADAYLCMPLLMNGICASGSILHERDYW